MIGHCEVADARACEGGPFYPAVVSFLDDQKIAVRFLDPTIDDFGQTVHGDEGSLCCEPGRETGRDKQMRAQWSTPAAAQRLFRWLSDNEFALASLIRLSENCGISSTEIAVMLLKAKHTQLLTLCLNQCKKVDQINGSSPLFKKYSLHEEFDSHVPLFQQFC